ncbi:SDR family NAD(P)-dependent oxidoreductase [Granulosicoccus antarcticus]|uniref:Fatty acyl-CoA reductase n=1 Tax=Granulosicoccus antarcticus IMCC3135 TaxID=1192854 RepID=A0A2Z2NRD3_9GAMM|nr:SDR family NAD(P)-dependent oxidoreductase [Granulosicoccus antarcticus]ASJ74002.1 Fatty acyl-CoA reductase [Granulosicoccus antarcticus IMCC3135]
MSKTILITGATDGIGLATAKMLVEKGHKVLLHGRNQSKLEAVAESLLALSKDASIECFVADLSKLSDVDALAQAVADKHQRLDVLINNAGVFKTPDAKTADGFDTRFMVNTIAPYRLTQKLLPLIGTDGRIINLSSAAQATVNLEALAGNANVSEMEAYAQSKLAITMWSRLLAEKADAPTVIAVNPGSMLGTKMVKQGFGAEGHDIGIGARILCRAALDSDFKSHSGQYFDNDSGQFAAPHADALNAEKSAAVVKLIDSILTQHTA